jgi:hypothetical protein
MPPPDLPNGVPIDANLSVSNPLEEDPHSTVTDLARFLG